MNNLFIRIEILVNVFASRVWLGDELSKLGLIEDGGGQSYQCYALVHSEKPLTRTRAFVG